MAVHSVRNYTDRAADHACFHNYPSVARLRNCGTSGVAKHHPQRRIHEVDEAQLCGPSLPIGPTGLTTLGRSWSGAKNPTCL